MSCRTHEVKQCQTFRGLGVVFMVRERSEKMHDLARARVERQQSLLLVDLVVDDLVSGTGNTTQIHMARVTLQDHVLFDGLGGLEGGGLLHRFLEEAHFPLPSPSEAKMQARSGSIVVQIFLDCVVRGRTLSPFGRLLRFTGSGA